LFLFMNNMWLG